MPEMSVQRLGLEIHLKQVKNLELAETQGL